MSGVVQQVASSVSGVILTDAAKKHLCACLSRENDCSGVRFSVKKTGCSGLSYVVDYVMAPEAADVVLPLNEEYHIYIDKKSYPYLKGMSMDYVKQGLNCKFVFNNPNQTGQCGCGESFTVENLPD